MTMATSARPRAIPEGSTPQFLGATSAQLAHLRGAFRDARFTFAELFRRGAAEEERESASPGAPAALDDACDVYRMLFAQGRPTPRAAIRRRLPDETVELLDALALLQPYDGDADALISPVLVCPLAGLWLWCDNPTILRGRTLPDIVYSPLTTNTQQFMLMLPRTPCDEVLELCGGTGVAALASARLSRAAVTADITERSTAFAAYNARFNDIRNAEAVCGDLYDPVRGRTFDRIVAHPPYMPNFEQEYVFRDGGADGEQITRRVIAGLPEHLREGGRFFCMCLATDRRDARLEERVRGWLGAAADEFDIFLTELQAPRDPTEFYAKRAYEDIGSFAEVDTRHRFFREAGITGLVYGAIALQRRRRARPTFTARRKKGPMTAGMHLGWAMDWETRLLDPDFTTSVVDMRPRPSDELRMRLTYAPRPDGFALVDSTLEVASPLAYEVETPGWVPQFLERCAGGAHTVREHQAALARDGIIPGDVPVEQLAEAVRNLATTGVVVLPGYEPPPPLVGSVEVLDEWPALAPDALAREAAGID
jgi:methylase of polypeptide subunit release factors